jgi:hypothetical protein
MARLGSMLIATTAAVVALSGCGGGSSSSHKTTSSSPGSSTSSVTAAQSATKTLPSPCSLLTKAEAAPVFGTTALDAVQSTPGAPGVSQCGFSLTAGVQAKSIVVRTRTDYAHDPSYVFPPPSTQRVNGLPYPAYTNMDPAQKVGTITVQLGGNALEIHVNGYDQPVSQDQLVQLAKDALARV